MKKAYAYLRKSTDRDDKQQLSLDAQRKEILVLKSRLEDFLKEKVEIIEWFEESVSAKSEDRPQFLSMMTGVRKKQVDIIIAWKLDRLSRNPTDSGRIMTSLQNGYVSYVYTNDQGYPYTKKDSGMLMGVLFSLANQFLLNLTEDVKSKMRLKVERGGIVSRVPFGLKNDRNTRSVILGPGSDYATEIFEMVKVGKPLRDIGLWLAERGYTSVDGKPYGAQTISRWIKNPIYYGVYEWAGEFFQAQIPQLVEKSLWDDANRAMGNITLPRIHAEKNTFPLKGMVRSAETLKPLSASLAKKEYVYYHTHAEDRKKENIKISQKDIIRWFDPQIDLYVPRGKVKDWLLEGLREAHHDQFERVSREKKRISKELSEIDLKMGNLIDMRASGELFAEGFKTKQREYIDREITLKSELEAIIKIDETLLATINESVELWTNLSTIWKNADEAGKAEIIKYISVELFVHDSVTLYVKENPVFLMTRLSNGMFLASQSEETGIKNTTDDFSATDGSATENRTPVPGMRILCPNH